MAEDKGGVDTSLLNIKFKLPIKYKLTDTELLAYGVKNGIDGYYRLRNRVGDPSLGFTPLSQRFGANAVPFYAQMGLLGHNGLDWIAGNWTYLYSPIDGVVTSQVKNDMTRGNYVHIESEELDYKGDKVKIRWVGFHLLTNFVEVGQKVRVGERLGICDNSGQYTTGSHLHDGCYLLYKSKNWGKDTSNGYAGAFDHSKLYDSIIINQDMILKKEKNQPHIYLIVDDTKILLKDFSTFQALKEDFEEVDSLADYKGGGTLFWAERTEDN